MRDWSLKKCIRRIWIVKIWSEKDTTLSILFLLYLLLWVSSQFDCWKGKKTFVEENFLVERLKDKICCFEKTKYARVQICSAKYLSASSKFQENTNLAFHWTIQIWKDFSLNNVYFCFKHTVTRLMAISVGQYLFFCNILLWLSVVYAPKNGAKKIKQNSYPV